MATLRNPPAEVLLGQMGLEIARFHKREASRLVAASGMKKPSTFYWRGRRGGSARKASSIEAIPDKPLSRPPATIAFIDAGKGTIIAEVAVSAASRFRRLAPVLTGQYAGSLVFSLNGRVRNLTTIVKFAASNPFSDEEQITLYPAVIYGSKLELDYYKRGSGIMTKIARELIAEFGARASIKFAYASGVKLGLPFKFAVPLIVIGAPGAFVSDVRRPGRKPRKNRRRRK